MQYQKQKNNVQYMNIKKKDVNIKKNIKEHGFLFHYNARTYPLLSISYIDFGQIPCGSSECLRKLSLPCHKIQDKHNQDKYKGENKNCVYWPILGSYKNWQIIRCVENRKQQ